MRRLALAALLLSACLLSAARADDRAANLAIGPFVTVVVIGAIMQNWRRKLRGATTDRPTGGYR